MLYIQHFIVVFGQGSHELGAPVSQNLVGKTCPAKDSHTIASAMDLAVIHFKAIASGHLVAIHKVVGMN